MSFETGYATGYYTGGGLSSLVPTVYPVAVDGHAFLIDRDQEGDGQFRYVTIPLLKQQQQSDGKLGEASINPGGLWRSAIETWHKGAGQANYDAVDSDPARFRTSKGVDPWTKNELTLLSDTETQTSSANTNLILAPTSSRLFWLDGTNVKYVDTLGSAASNMTGSPGNTWKSIATNGYDQWATDGSNVYNWTRSATAVGAAWNTADVDLLVWVRGKGRLMGALNTGSTRSVYNITSAAAPTDIKPAIISADFTWVGFAEGPSVIYGGGYQGDKSLIFRWGIDQNDGSLDVAIPALVDGLPDGEIIRWLYSYLGFLLIGTDNGIRFAIPDKTTGDLTLGQLIETDSPVRCFEGQGSAVWYGLTNLDDTSTGLGRINLGGPLADPELLVPAYAPDLMATAQGNVLSVCTYAGKRVFTVSEAGVFYESDDLVTEGVLYTGWRTFGIPEDKVAHVADIRHDPLEGTVSVSLATDGSTTYTVVATSSTEASTGATVALEQTTAEKFETKYTLTPSGDDATAGPRFTREVLAVNPTADNGFKIILPVILEATQTVNNQTFNRRPDEELDFIQELRASRRTVTAQIGSSAYSVSIEDFVWLPGSTLMSLPDGTAFFQGTCILDLKVV